jgi:hypothetical protein
MEKGIRCIPTSFFGHFCSFLRAHNFVVTDAKLTMNKHFASTVSFQRSHHLGLSLPTKVSKISWFTLFFPTQDCYLGIKKSDSLLLLLPLYHETKHLKLLLLLLLPYYLNFLG